MWLDWVIFVSGGAVGYLLKWGVDTAACRCCQEAIRYREALLKQMAPRPYTKLDTEEDSFE